MKTKTNKTKRKKKPIRIYSNVHTLQAKIHKGPFLVTILSNITSPRVLYVYQKINISLDISYRYIYIFLINFPC